MTCRHCWSSGMLAAKELYDREGLTSREVSIEYQLGGRRVWVGLHERCRTEVRQRSAAAERLEGE